MKHEQIWNAVDKLAESRGLSPSGLAKLGGLDATTFNKSKRVRPDGNKRWPSLDSINKILKCCGLSFENFYALGVNGNDKDLFNSIPFHKLSALNDSIEISDKQLITQNWNKIIFPDMKDSLYAIDIDANTYAPFYRQGTTIIATANSDIRTNDRIIIFYRQQPPVICEFVRRTATQLIVCDINNPDHQQNIPISDILLIHRIVWASQ